MKYSNRYNFNLTSLSRLLINDWRIVKGDETSITVEHDNGGAFKFDIVIPTVCEAIFACQFIQDVDINAANTDAGTRLNIDNVHRLLVHGDEDSTRQTVNHLHWVITCGKMKPCLACEKGKIKTEECLQSKHCRKLR